MLEAANMIVIGSIAASRSSFDPHYSAVKSSLEAFVKSYSKKLEFNKSIVTLSPSLIENSKMYKDMDSLTREKHYLHSNNKLLSTKQVADLIFALTPEITANMNGRTLAIGNDY
jgi:NAD(P)-dependent dehydrogenase (short-subunit alcohol dehydrogenase family)